jgi:anti-anti-sigma factor
MLKVDAEELGAIKILHFQGQIVNGEAATTLREAVFAQAGASVVVLELAGVDIIDAGGLGVLLELREWTQSKGIEFRLMNVNKLVQQVFEITRLDSVFHISSKGDARPVAARRIAGRERRLRLAGKLKRSLRKEGNRL